MSKITDLGKGRVRIEYEKVSVYEGGFLNGKMEGRGALTFFRGDEYKGEWKDGKQCGQGICISSSGDKYEGEWKDGKQCGQGIFTSSNGNKYEGEWKDGKQCGQGILTFSNGASVSGAFNSAVFIPGAREKGKSTHQILIFETKKDLSEFSDMTLAIANPYGIGEDQIKRVDEATSIPPIKECICERKDGFGFQLVAAIIGHGSPDGKFVNPDFIKGKLGELLDQIKTYNTSDPDEKKVKRVKLNFSVCYGDACIMNSLLELIKTFTDAGIEVRTSAIKGDSVSSAIIGNGKNYAEVYGNETVIVERLFTSSKLEAEKFMSEKGEKYQELVLSTENGEIFCASGEKHYKNLEDLLRDEYVKPSTIITKVMSTISTAAKEICIIS